MFNLRDPDFKANPYPFYQKFRHETPICRVEPHGLWAVFRHEDVVHVLKNFQTFSSEGIGIEPKKAGPDFLLGTRGMLAKDPPDHSRLRKRLGKAFTGELLHSLVPHIDQSVQFLTTQMQQKSPIDFVKDFSAPLPIMVICRLLGFDETRVNDIKRWSDILLSWQTQPNTDENKQFIATQMGELYEFMVDALKRKKQTPSNDIISSLVHARSTKDELSFEEIISFVRMLMVAGTDTTTHLLGNTVLAFTRYPEIYSSLKTNPNVVGDLIEESLRFDSPVQCVMRRAAVDTTIAHVPIRKDEIILAFVGSANHDERVYERPEQFIISRTPQHHLTFGTGIHFCLGSNIAKLQAKIALNHLTNHVETWQRRETTLSYFDSIFFRGLTSLFINHV